MIIQIPCKHCGGPIDADHEELNQAVDCPHCHQKTFLSSPKISRAAPPLAPAAPGTPATIAPLPFKRKTPSWLYLLLMPAGVAVVAALIMALAGDFNLALIAAISILVTAYFIPTWIAHSKYNSHAIFILNLFLGWTFLGWVIALVWASTKDPKYSQTDK